MTVLSAYGLLLLSAFLSATLLPGSSEAVLLGLLATGHGSPFMLIAVASVGNIAGAALNWALGRAMLQLRDRPWFPLKDATSGRAQQWFARYGIWALLLSWVPLIGDGLTLVAGVMRVRIVPFLILVSIAKVGRYAAVVWGWQFLA